MVKVAWGGKEDDTVGHNDLAEDDISLRRCSSTLVSIMQLSFKLL